MARTKKTPTTAHRIAFELFVGRIPKGMCVCHRCDHPWCVRPDHLFLGTPADNMLDRNQKGRQARGERCGKARLRAHDVIEIRRAWNAKENNQKQLSRKFGVYPQTVWFIVHNKTWRHVV
jgi:hypothetical protein